MGVYIKGMEIPKDEAVALYIYPDGRAKLWRPQALVGHELEAVSVPPHGRLVDADKLGFAMMDAANADQALAMVDDAPTIIEAEEGET